MSIADWAMVLVAITFAMSTFVVFVWGLGAPWYRTETGRAFWLTELSLCLLVGPSVIAYWFHFQIGEWWALGILAFIAATSILRASVSFKKQILERIKRHR